MVTVMFLFPFSVQKCISKCFFWCPVAQGGFVHMLQSFTAGYLWGNLCSSNGSDAEGNSARSVLAVCPSRQMENHAVKFRSSISTQHLQPYKTTWAGGLQFRIDLFWFSFFFFFFGPPKVVRVTTIDLWKSPIKLYRHLRIKLVAAS